MTETEFVVTGYDLGTTLDSGQAFRWERRDGGWEGVVGDRWIRMEETRCGMRARVAAAVSDWAWLRAYLQVELDLSGAIATFPADPGLRAAVRRCRGLRLLRQDVWECLASFILSSTKQIIQIRQIVGLLCSRHGRRLIVPVGHPSAFAFPDPATLACLSESELRACKMGFRARYLRETAQSVAQGHLDLAELRCCGAEQARAQLMELPGVGRKIADCVLLFACGYQEVFPVDVWIARVLRAAYFAGQNASMKEVMDFSARHFGPFGGLAQQYLFHWARTQRPGRQQGPAPPGPATKVASVL